MDVIQDQAKDQHKLQKQTHLRHLQLQKNQHQQQKEIHDDLEHHQQYQQQQSQHQQQQQQQQQQNQGQQRQQQDQQYKYALQSNLQKISSQSSKKSNLMLINAYLSDDKLNQEVLLVHAINSVGCKNYGLAADLVDIYPYSETAGGRYCDSNLKCITRKEDQTPEGLCLVHSSPLYIKGLKNSFLSHTVWSR